MKSGAEGRTGPPAHPCAFGGGKDGALPARLFESSPLANLLRTGRCAPQGALRSAVSILGPRPPPFFKATIGAKRRVYWRVKTGLRVPWMALERGGLEGRARI
ncbi:MAG: hypothetical protein NDJ90_02530, partial [Oligoflexia bacterium]|nr:hypothetical protein [Oligoflexia bacterium]